MNNKEQLVSIPTIAKELNHDRKWVELRLTEFENMEDNGFYRIYDCGTIKVVWRK